MRETQLKLDYSQKYGNPRGVSDLRLGCIQELKLPYDAFFLSISWLFPLGVFSFWQSIFITASSTRERRLFFSQRPYLRCDGEGLISPLGACASPLTIQRPEGWGALSNQVWVLRHMPSSGAHRGGGDTPSLPPWKEVGISWRKRAEQTRNLRPLPGTYCVVP